jgi:DnaJ family protein C protein 13
MLITPCYDLPPACQALLTAWRAELARTPLSLSEADACAVLGLKPGPDGAVAEDDVRRAYRALARK